VKSSMPDLQILRFVAAALVLVSHVQHEALKSAFLSLGAYHPWNGIYLAGGVDIFFVISGFIMYAIGSGEFGKAGAAKRFMLRRIVRIVPPYWLFTSAMILAAIVFRDHVTHSALSIDHILASYFFLPYDNAYGKAYPVLMLGWTLNYEFFFYVIFALALLFGKRIGLFVVFGIIGCFGLLGATGVLDKLPFSFWGNPIVFEFLFGIVLAMMHERGSRLSSVAGWLLAAAGFAAMWILNDLGVAGNYWNARIFWMGLPALAICAGVVLRKNPEPGAVKNWFVLLGDASYSIYLSHPFALNAVALLWKSTGVRNAWIYVTVACLASLLVGVLVHLMIEKPMTAYLNKMIDRRLGQRRGGVLPVT
jgi:exopolysaccharide production protein ExoZ